MPNKIIKINDPVNGDQYRTLDGEVGKSGCPEYPSLNALASLIKSRIAALRDKPPGVTENRNYSLSREQILLEHQNAQRAVSGEGDSGISLPTPPTPPKKPTGTRKTICQTYSEILQAIEKLRQKLYAGHRGAGRPYLRTRLFGKPAPRTPRADVDTTGGKDVRRSEDDFPQE